MSSPIDKPKTVRFAPPLQMFKDGGIEQFPEGVVPSNQLVTPTYRIDTPPEGGVLSYEVGNKYPVKGWFFREAIFAVDTIKRAVMNIVKLLASSPIRYIAALFVFLPAPLKRRAIRKVIDLFADYSFLVFERWGRTMRFEAPDGRAFAIKTVVFEANFYCDMVREVRRVGMEMAGDNWANQQLVETLCMFLEHDDGYRYRIQDLMGEMDRKAFLRSPGREAARILRIAIERGQGTRPKFEPLAKLLPIVFRVRIIREAALEFFEKVDLTKLTLDEADAYRCLLWTGWKFHGIPDEQRISLRMMIDASWQLSQKPT